MHIHLFAHHLFMGQHHFDELPVSIGLALQALVETRLLHSELIGQILLQRVGAVAGVISAQLDDRAPWLREGNLGAGDGQAVFIDHSDSDTRAR